MTRQILALFLIAFVITSTLAQQPWTPAGMIQYKRMNSPVMSDDGRLVAYVVASPRMEGEQIRWGSFVGLAQDNPLKTRVTLERTALVRNSETFISTSSATWGMPK